jgi:hypothetical protein
MEDKRNAHSVLVAKSEGKKSLEIPRCTCEDTIKTYLTDIGWEGMDWIHLAQKWDMW